MEHSKIFGFSSAHRWAYCSGAPTLCADIEEPVNDDALEGLAAHWVGEQMLQTYKMGADGLALGMMLIGKKTPVGLIVTEDMVDGAIVYYKAVTAIAVNRKDLHIEVRVSAHHTLDPQAWGTADAIYYDVATNTLYVWDFKFGFRRVKAYQNLQLAGYATAAIETFKLGKMNPRCELTIVQPRCYDGEGAIQTWVTSQDYMRAEVNIMKSSIIEYRMNKGRLVTGDHCRDCRGRHLCPSLMETGAKIIETSKEVMSLNPTNEALSFELDLVESAIKRLEQRKTALEVEAENRVRNGQVVPGRVMKDTLGNRAWNQPNQNVYALGEMFGMNFKQEDKPVSPAQAEKLLARKGVDASVMKPYYHKPKGGAKLVYDDGSRAKQIFSQEKLCQPNPST